MIGVKKLKSALDDELGINEPYLNPDPTASFFRYKGNWFTKNKDGEIIRFYPPGLKQPRSKTKSQL